MLGNGSSSVCELRLGYCGQSVTPDCPLHFLQEVSKVFHGNSTVLGSSRSPGCVGVQVDGKCVLQWLPWPSPPCHFVQLFPFLCLFPLYFSKRAKARGNILLFLFSTFK